MKSGPRKILIVVFLVFAGASIAAYVNRWPSQLFPHQGKVIRMSFGLGLAPYVMADSARGFQLDIIREALAMSGHTLKPEFVPLAHVPNLLKTHQVDAAERGSPELVEGQGVYYAKKKSVEYADFAITLKKNNLQVNSVDDLSNLRVMAFQKAADYLGPQYAAAVARNSRYTETSDQKRQALMLYSGGVDVVISDHNIFKYFAQQVGHQVDATQEVVYHRVFNPPMKIYNSEVFVDPQVRDDYDKGLEQLKASGRLDQLMKLYITR